MTLLYNKVMEISDEKYFYIKDYKYIENGEIDISFLPMMIRRRLSSIDKYAIYTLSAFKDCKIDEIVYSSRYGELERLFKIIDQYIEDNEVSPNLFSSSVHNYLVGLFSQINNFYLLVQYLKFFLCLQSLYRSRNRNRMELHLYLLYILIKYHT